VDRWNCGDEAAVFWKKAFDLGERRLSAALIVSFETAF
jgi:hypothetical protein